MAGRKKKPLDEERMYIIELRAEGKTYRQIAEETGRSADTVRSIVSSNLDALEKVRKEKNDTLRTLTGNTPVDNAMIHDAYKVMAAMALKRMANIVERETDMSKLQKVVDGYLEMSRTIMDGSFMDRRKELLEKMRVWQEPMN